VLVQALVASGELAVLPTTLPRMWRDFSLVQRAGKRRSPALAAFVQACRSQAQE
jgi:DNA-binding transcriptional LysR family regulator